MRIYARVLVTIVLALAVSTSVAAAPETVIRIGNQPELYSLPDHLPQAAAIFAQDHLRPQFTKFLSGAAMLEAFASGRVDVGQMGWPPALVGAARGALYIVGIANDESLTNVLLLRPADVPKFKADPKAFLKGKNFLLTTISTAHMVLIGCLNKYGLGESDANITQTAPPSVVTALPAGQGDAAAIWSPFMFYLVEKGMVPVCNARDAGLPMYAALVARKEFADQHPEIVADYLNAFLRGAEEIKKQGASPTMVEKHQEFSKAYGIELTRGSFVKDIKMRPFFTLQQQLQLFAPQGATPSEIDRYSERVAEFMISHGVIKNKFDMNAVLTDRFLKMVVGQRAKTR